MNRHARTHAPTPLLTRAIAVGLVLVATVAAAAFALGGTGAPVAGPSTPGATPRSSAGSSAAPPAVRPSAQADAKFTLVATGDVLPHTPVLTSARSGGGYDFGPLLAPLDAWVSGADIALCHMEVPFAPKGKSPSGYPIFGAPKQLAVDLKKQGWDGCSTASNHSVDRGFAGVKATLDAFDAAGLGHAGTARTKAEADAPQLYRLERDGQTITVAHIAAAYGTNGMPVDADKPWSVQLIDTDQLIAQATKARANGADLVVASIHCCQEYVTEPTALQKETDQKLADSGEIDLVIGHHAHVPQPVAKLDGGPRGKGMWVAYGLGNFLSNQDGACCTSKTDSGILLTAHFRKPADGPAEVSGVEWTGVTVDRLGRHRVYALAQIADGKGHLSAGEVGKRLARVASAAGDEAPERTKPATATGPPPEVVRR